MKLFEFKTSGDILIDLEKIKTQVKTKADEINQLSTSIFNEKTIDGVKIDKTGKTTYFTIGSFANSNGSNATSNVKKNMMMGVTITDDNGVMKYNIVECDTYPDLLKNDKLKASVSFGNLKKGVISGKYLSSLKDKINLVYTAMGIKSINNFTYKHKPLQKNEYDDQFYPLYIDLINDINDLDLFDKDFKSQDKSQAIQFLKSSIDSINSSLSVANKEKKKRDGVNEQNAVAKIDRKINLLNDVKKCISIKTNNAIDVNQKTTRKVNV